MEWGLWSGDYGVGTTVSVCLHSHGMRTYRPYPYVIMARELLVADFSSHVPISRELIVPDFSSHVPISRDSFIADLSSHVPISRDFSIPNFSVGGVQVVGFGI